MRSSVDVVIIAADLGTCRRADTKMAKVTADSRASLP